MVSIIPRVDLLGNTGGLDLQTFIFSVGHPNKVSCDHDTPYYHGTLYMLDPCTRIDDFTLTM